MIWNDGIIASHAGWFLNSCLIIKRTWNNRLVTAQLELKQTELLLNRQQILHPKTWEQADCKGVAMIHLDFPFYTSHLLLVVVAVQSLSFVWVFVTPCIAVHQASLYFTVSQSLFKLMSIELVMPSNYLILCRLFLLLPSVIHATNQERELKWVYAQGQSVKGEYLDTWKIGHFHIHLGWHGLRTLIDRCKLHNDRLYYPCLSHNSVCYNQ